MKQQKVRLEIARATRLNVAGAARNTDMGMIEDKYKISSDGIGGTRALGCFYSGGDWWN